VFDPLISDPLISDPLISDPLMFDPLISDPLISDPLISDPLIETLFPRRRIKPSRIQKCNLFRVAGMHVAHVCRVAATGVAARQTLGALLRP
jgi:hypothetical protein